MKKILISSCLMGEPVRYDKKGTPVDHKLIRLWKEQGRLIPVCPEMLGGLPAPRPCCEISGTGGGDAVLAGRAIVKGADGADLTKPFVEGAHQVLVIARQQNASIAILKERSPSCGSHVIYDGHFASCRISGRGVTAALLEREGIRVFCEDELPAVENLLED